MFSSFIKVRSSDKPLWWHTVQVIGVAGAAALIAFTAQAQSTGAIAKEAAEKIEKSSPVSVELTQHKVTLSAQGTEQLGDAATVKPGDVIEYRATYTNHSEQPVTGLTANLPIPAGLEYVPKSAKPGAQLVTASTGDGKFAPEPLRRKSAGGATEPVPYNEYRAMRWSLGQLPAHASAAVSVRAKVETAAIPTAEGSPAVSVQPAKR